VVRLFALALWALLLAACDAAGPASADAPASPAPSPPPAAQLRAPAEAGYPALIGRVVDQAGLLGPEEESRLAAASAELERHTTDQLVIVTVPSLDGRPIEDFARALGNHWGIGQKDRDNGVLLVVAPNERRVRIATGYGLEAILTNARSGEIIERDLLPAFRESKWSEGISAGAEAIIRTLVEHADEPRRGRP
jgi:uncharacterized protein